MRTYSDFIFGRYLPFDSLRCFSSRGHQKNSAECLKSQSIPSNSMASHNPFSYSCLLSSAMEDSYHTKKFFLKKRIKCIIKTPLYFSTSHILTSNKDHRRSLKQKFKDLGLPMRVFFKRLEKETLIRNKVTVCVI